MDIYYINSAGDRLDLLSDKIAIQEPETLFKNTWEYSAATSMIFGGKVKKFYKSAQEKDFTISIVADNQEDFTELCKQIEDVVFYDLQVKSPGRLYVNETYLTCYIFESEYTEYEDLFYMTDKKFTLITEYPNWIVEHVYTVNKNVSLINAVAGLAVTGRALLNTGVDPDNDDSGETTKAFVRNTQKVPCNFRVKMNGPSEWPHLVVGDNTYNFDYEIPEGAYILVDSIKKTCTLHESDGSVTNVFGYRDPDYYIFEKIASGVNEIQWNERNVVEFTIYEERGEPLWS